MIRVTGEGGMSVRSYGMRHVSHVIWDEACESCHMGWDVSDMNKWGMSHMNEWGMSHMNKYGCKVTYEWMRHVTYEGFASCVNETCHICISLVTCGCVIALLVRTCSMRMHHVLYKCVVVCDWVMSRVNETCLIYQSHVWHDWYDSRNGIHTINHSHAVSMIGHVSYTNIWCMIGIWDKIHTLRDIVNDSRDGIHTINHSHAVSMIGIWDMSHVTRERVMSHMHQRCYK